MAGYTPGEQPKPDERVVKLNTNENPFPPSPHVLDAIRRIPGVQSAGSVRDLPFRGNGEQVSFGLAGSDTS